MRNEVFESCLLLRAPPVADRVVAQSMEPQEHLQVITGTQGQWEILVKGDPEQRAAAPLVGGDSSFLEFPPERAQKMRELHSAADTRPFAGCA
eukprot:200559-Amphidinium_carterae.2